MLNKLEIVRNWLPRYTGMPLDKFGDYILLTNFSNYVRLFAEEFGCDVYGEDRSMPAATNDAGLTIINFGMGSSNAATIMDLLSSIQPKGVLFLGKCGPAARRPGCGGCSRRWGGRVGGGGASLPGPRGGATRLPPGRHVGRGSPPGC